MKELHEMTLDEIITMQTGQSLMMLGSGESMKSIISDAMRTALQWKGERDQNAAKSK